MLCYVMRTRARIYADSFGTSKFDKYVRAPAANCLVKRRGRRAEPGVNLEKATADRWSESVYRISLTQIKIDIPREGGRVGHHNHARYQWTDMRASAAFGSRLARRE